MKKRIISSALAVSIVLGGSGIISAQAVDVNKTGVVLKSIEMPKIVAPAIKPTNIVNRPVVAPKIVSTPPKTVAPAAKPVNKPAVTPIAKPNNDIKAKVTPKSTGSSKTVKLAGGSVITVGGTVGICVLGNKIWSSFTKKRAIAAFENAYQNFIKMFKPQDSIAAEVTTFTICTPLLNDLINCAKELQSYLKKDEVISLKGISTPFDYNALNKIIDDCGKLLGDDNNLVTQIILEYKTKFNYDATLEKKEEEESLHDSDSKFDDFDRGEAPYDEKPLEENYDQVSTLSKVNELIKDIQFLESSEEFKNFISDKPMELNELTFVKEYANKILKKARELKPYFESGDVVKLEERVAIGDYFYTSIDENSLNNFLDNFKDIVINVVGRIGRITFTPAGNSPHAAEAPTYEPTIYDLIANWKSKGKIRCIFNHVNIRPDNMVLVYEGTNKNLFVSNEIYDVLIDNMEGMDYLTSEL